MEKRTLHVLQCNYNALMNWVLWALEVILVTVVVVFASVEASGLKVIRC